MRWLAAVVACGLLSVSSAGCVSACGQTAFIPAELVGAAAYYTQVNVARAPIRKDLALVLNGEPGRTPTAEYREAAARLERNGRQANEVISQEDDRARRKPGLLASRDYLTVLRLTARADPDGSLSNADLLRSTIDRAVSPGPDGVVSVKLPTGRRRTVPTHLVPRLLARREELDELIAELKLRVAERWSSRRDPQPLDAAADASPRQ
jgi:hypothetical protein